MIVLFEVLFVAATAFAGKRTLPCDTIIMSQDSAVSHTQGVPSEVSTSVSDMTLVTTVSGLVQYGIITILMKTQDDLNVTYPEIVIQTVDMSWDLV